MKGKIVVKNLLVNEDLILEVGKSVVEITMDTLSIRVDFPEVYTTKDITWDETGNHMISEPADYIFKETPAFLELEMPIKKDVFTILNQLIKLDPDEELTNFYIAENHHPTFDDEILITCQNLKYLLTWMGSVPDIHFGDFEQSMLKEFEFTLITETDLIE
ncbi:MAG: hypothetical protein LBV72_13430 [Tannerella sp.]|jgi:hypothetical protein|nr:hypothetical protein [Tannerella sp.]